MEPIALDHPSRAYAHIAAKEPLQGPPRQVECLLEVVHSIGFLTGGDMSDGPVDQIYGLLGLSALFIAIGLNITEIYQNCRLFTID
jgi:hypothetical protein